MSRMRRYILETLSVKAPAVVDGPGPRTGHPHCPSLSEAELVRLWEGQRFPAEALVTAEGLPLRVLFRGRPCAGGPGPDFRDAVIATAGGQELRGDIELHVLTSAFRQHGHHRDPAYDNLILHVVFWDDGDETPLASGRRPAVVALAPWVAGRAKELSRWLSRPALWQEPCRTASRRLGAQAVADILDEAGDRRFQEKATRFRTALAELDPEEVLYQGLLEALGYSRNREPFRLLAQALPWRLFRRRIQACPAEEKVPTAEAAVLGTAGFLSPQAGSKANRYLAELGERWRAWPQRRQPSFLPWRLVGIRPENHPARRLAGAARLLLRYLDGGLVDGLLEAVSAASEAGPQALTAALEAAGDGFWLGHYDLHNQFARLPRALIGPQRAGEMAVNVVLPFALAWAESRRDEPLAQAALGLYRRYPGLSPYGILRTLTAALGRGLTAGARRQQGMLHIFHHYCCRGGCAGPSGEQAGCPLT